MGKWTGIILAAGAGKRMAGGGSGSSRSGRGGGSKSSPKVMLPIAHLPMLGHVLLNLKKAKAERLVLVLAPKSKEVETFARALVPEIEIVVQDRPQGTGQAVQAALAKVKTPITGRIVVAYGDTPLVKSTTYRKLAEHKAALALVGFRGNKKGYGRIMLERGRVQAIQEDDGKQALGEGILNAGLMAFDIKKYKKRLDNLSNNNPKKEFYLTDLATEAGATEAAEATASSSFGALVLCGEQELQGANTLAELAQLEQTYQEAARADLMSNGVYMEAPEHVFLAWDTKIAKGARLAPYITFGVGVQIGAHVEIKSFCHLEGAKVAADCVIGPYARLRPDTQLNQGVHIGNFVEVKRTTMGKGSKANHLTYLGDSEIGVGANIGAGTITCNYDGKEKHKTTIGDKAFIGSNTSLVAPVKIGKGAYIGSGSVITKDVEPKTLVVARGRQKTIRKIK